MLRLALIAPLVLASAAHAGPGFWLPGLPPGTTGGSVQGVSWDGSLAVGGAGNGMITPGFSWTAVGGRHDFGLGQGMPALSPAYGVSSDGGTIVGWFGESLKDPPYFTQHAYRLVGNGPLEDLGLLPNEQRSYATDISGDGQIVVGTCEHGQSNSAGKAFRWTQQGGMKSLGFLKPQSNFSKAHGISRDGSTIVGMSQKVNLVTDAYRWTESEGMVELPDLPGGPYEWSEALAVNADGSVIVGYSPAADKKDHAVRWVNGQIEELAPGLNSSGYARATDDSGNIIGGNYKGVTAFVWTPATGAVDLADFLAEHGIEVPADYRLEYIYTISGDGLTFAGSARNLVSGKGEGFVATIPSPATFLLFVVPLVVPRRRRG